MGRTKELYAKHFYQELREGVDLERSKRLAEAEEQEYFEKQKIDEKQQ